MTDDTQKEVSASRIYEVGYHVLPSVEGSEIDVVVNEIREIISKAGGALIAEGAPQRIELAYTMYINNEGKNTAYKSANFGWIKFEMQSDKLHEIETLLKMHKKILRSIVFKTVREETRSSMRASMLKEVRRGETLKSNAKAGAGARTEEKIAVSEEKLDEAIEGITGEV